MTVSNDPHLPPVPGDRPPRRPGPGRMVWAARAASHFHLNLPGHAVLTPSPFVKMLGVTLDPTLSWEKHTSNVAKKCNSILCLYKIRHHLSPDILNLLIQCHAFPHILYCLSVWGGAAACHLHRVQKVVNFGARIVSGVRIAQV